MENKILTITDEFREKWDFASEVLYKDFDVFRLKSTDALIGKSLNFKSINGRNFSITCLEKHKMKWEENGESAEEWCEVTEVDPNVFFINMTFKNDPMKLQNIVVNTISKQAFIVTQFMADVTLIDTPAVSHIYDNAILDDGPATGFPPEATRDLIGVRAHLRYSDTLLYEHIYLNSKRYVFQNLQAHRRNEGHIDPSTMFKFEEGLYVFSFQEYPLPISSLFVFNYKETILKATGIFFVRRSDGSVYTSFVGGDITIVSKTFYPTVAQPI